MAQARPFQIRSGKSLEWIGTESYRTGGVIHRATRGMTLPEAGTGWVSPMDCERKNSRTSLDALRHPSAIEQGSASQSDS